MEKLNLEKQGRVIIPKKIRDKLNLREGKKLSIELEGNKIILKPLKDLSDFSSQLKGCVSESKIDPLELKKIWEM